LRNIYGQQDITTEIKSNRLEWLGHVARMEDNRMVKKVFEGHVGGRRKIGRPRKRWLDDIEEGLRLMKENRWRKKATKREIWAKIVSVTCILTQDAGTSKLAEHYVTNSKCSM
jgi:hypothetical protein